ncbi:MAG: hypothetical protein KKB30_15090 [Proteobacteria bacterium]|nr:hypothetical protein [Pseudomonadota bacterium]MBU1714387.1 hypothetical protein [Pseudomonadota bacterium]
MRFVIHMVLHLAAPGITARLFFSKLWLRAWIIMVLTMAVDLDHLLAEPVFDPNRCGIGFHPLHSLVAIFIYGVAAFFPVTRVIACGLLLHMVLDGLDCLWLNW